MNVLMLSKEKVSILLNKPVEKGVGHLCGNEGHPGFDGWKSDNDIACEKFLLIVHAWQ